MSPMEHLTAILMEERYRELARWRRFYHLHPTVLVGTKLEHDIERRALVRIRWAARRASRQARQAVA